MSRLSELDPARVHGFHNLPTQKSEEDHIREAAQAGGMSFDKILKFKKGFYVCDNADVPLGSEYVVHCVGWVKEWVKFKNRRPVDRKKYRVRLGEKAPDRDQLDEATDETWERDPRGVPQDPWTLAYLVPMEQAGGGDMHIFQASSFGARRAVEDLCLTWVRDTKRGNPIIKLQKGSWRSQTYGEILQPKFEIVGWDGGGKHLHEINIKPDDFGGDGGANQPIHDDIPF